MSRFFKIKTIGTTLVVLLLLLDVSTACIILWERNTCNALTKQCILMYLLFAEPYVKKYLGVIGHK